jgi:hypothetical protein
MTRLMKIQLAVFVLGCLIWAATVAAVCGQCTGGTCQVPQTPPNPAVCRVRNDHANERWYGSGTLIDTRDGKGLVITCWHIFREAQGTISVGFVGGQRCSARLIAADQAWDLAALEIDNPPTVTATIAADYPRPGEQLTACGYGPDGYYRCVAGQALGYVRTSRTDTDETLELTGAAREGDSGGPVFNARGEVCAVLWGTDGRTIGATYCGRIRKFLANILGRHRGQPAIAGGGTTPPQGGNSGGGSTDAAPPPLPAAPLVPVERPPCDGIKQAIEQINALRADLQAIKASQSNAPSNAAEAAVGQQVSEAVQAAVEPLEKRQGGLDEKLGRIEGLIQKIRGEPIAATGSGIASRVGDLAASAATKWLIGLGVPGIAAAGGVWLGRRLVRRQLAKRFGQSAATEAATTTSNSQQVVVPYMPTTTPDDYAKTWALHRQATGGNVQHDALRCQLYEEAVAKLRAGEINVGSNGAMIADAIDTWVINQFYERVTSAAAIGNIYHTALRGFLYKEAVNRLRSGEIQCLGHRETADAIEAWVRREFVKRVQTGKIV